MDPAARQPPQLADHARGLRHVFVRDLVLDASIGVHKHERTESQAVRVNIDLAIHEGPRPLADRLDEVVCYGDIVAGVKAIVEGGHVNLVETLAEHIAERCLEDPRVARARVRVEKLGAIPEAASVGVEIERARAATPGQP